jgi:anaerobic ribonucleoside-triphosphate reductase activating protein
MTIRLASKLQTDSIVDGEGIRTVIWTQGCPHKCPGCHNPETHDKTSGFVVNIEEIKKEISLLKGQDGITLSGGEPFEQVHAIYEIVSYAKEKGLNIWCYTGYTFEQLLEKGKKEDVYIKALQKIDVLIDGKFIQKLKSFNCAYRGSTNQRIIDVKESLLQNKVVQIEKYDTQNEFKDLYVKPEYIFI